MASIAIQRKISQNWTKIVRAAKKAGVRVDGVKLPSVGGIRLLGESTKTIKGEGIGVLTKIIYLAPGDSSGVELCPQSTPECRLACLGERAGRMVMTDSRNARIWKTMLYIGGRNLFIDLLRVEIAAHGRSARKKGMMPAVRLDGSSDTSLGLMMAREFPNIYFYDYSKIFGKAKKSLAMKNYSVCFSYSGRNLFETRSYLSLGGTVSVVFDTKKDEKLPETWQGYLVIDGDETDARFLDQSGVVVGLRLKGGSKARDPGCFVVKVRHLIEV